MVWSLISWYFLLLGLGWLSFPLTFRLMNKLPDRGYALSRILGLLLWGFVFWLFVNLGLLQNTQNGILFGLAIVLGVSLWAGWGKWREIWGWIKSNWRLILTTELVFLIGFGFMVLVRASDPDATGTEKPMELAFINAVINSITFPPHDPWLSGYAISYYHFGYILASLLAKITGVSGGMAFNLMLAAVFGMSAAGAYGVLYNLLAEFKQTIAKQINNLTWGLLGPVFLLFVSNLEVVFEMLHQAGIGWDLGVGTSRFWQWVNIDSLRIPPQKPLTLLPHRFWWWWQSSRVIHDIDLLGNVSGLSPIDEFPAFSFVLGDLHPHVLVIPFVMLLVGLAFNTYLGGMNNEEHRNNLKSPFRLDLLIVSAIALGGITFTNTWDLPVYFSLMVGAYGLDQVKSKGWGWGRINELLRLAIPLGILSIVFYTPFFISFQSQAGGILPNLVYPTRGFYLWLMFAPLLIPMFLFGGWLWQNKAKGEWKRASILVLGLVGVLYFISIALGYGLVRSEGGQNFLASQGQSTFLGLIGAAFWHRLQFGLGLLTVTALLVWSLALLIGLFKNREDGSKPVHPAPFVLLLILLGGLMVLAPEFIYLSDVFGARMNTIFKFYYQAWMIWAMGAAFATAVIYTQGRWIAKSLVTIFLILGLIYPVFAFLSKTNQFNPIDGFSLDASAYLVRTQPDEAAAIRWLGDKPQGVVAEAVGGQYSGFARVSTHSGQAAVLGWPGHQGQWRGSYKEVGSRETDIRDLYETYDWDHALDIIQQYGIDYIYVGSLEMSTYLVRIEKFDQNLQTGFLTGNVKVYVVPKTLKN